MLFQLGVIDWLPDETLFSLASRHHLVSGNATPAQTCQQLFGHQRIGSAHDLPARVGHLCRQASGLLGTAPEVIHNHSIAPIYLPFHTPLRCANWLIQMEVGSASQMKAELGLAAARFGASHPLRACPQCMEQDVRDHHVAYWHTVHQLPGVRICPTHRNSLLTTHEKSSGLNRFGWVLPMSADLVAKSDVTGSRDLLLALAEGAIAIWRLPQAFQFHPSRLHVTYRSRLIHAGLMSASGRADHASLNSVFMSMLVGLGELDELAWLPNDVRAVANRFVRHLSETAARESHHPLKHLLLILALFGTWSRFWEAYVSAEATESGERHAAARDGHDTSRYNAGKLDDRKIRFQSLLNDQHISITAAAKTVGVAVGTAMSWVAGAGKSTPRRPKILTSALRSAVVAALKGGADKKVAAQLANISVESVTRLLLTEPGLHELWEQSRFATARGNARHVWAKTMRSLPIASSNEWRQLQPASYSWLYRNDRLWLRESIQNRQRAATRSRAGIQWDKRDLELAQLVRTSTLNWQCQHPGKRLTIAILCTQVHTLKSRLSSLGRLPLTRVALSEVSARRATVLPGVLV